MNNYEEKINNLEDLPVSEEMIGAYMEGTLPDVEANIVSEMIESDPDLYEAYEDFKEVPMIDLDDNDFLVHDDFPSDLYDEWVVPGLDDDYDPIMGLTIDPSTIKGLELTPLEDPEWPLDPEDPEDPAIGGDLPEDPAEPGIAPGYIAPYYIVGEDGELVLIDPNDPDLELFAKYGIDPATGFPYETEDPQWIEPPLGSEDEPELSWLEHRILNNPIKDHLGLHPSDMLNAGNSRLPFNIPGHHHSEENMHLVAYANDNEEITFFEDVTPGSDENDLSDTDHYSYDDAHNESDSYDDSSNDDSSSFDNTDNFDHYYE